MAQFTKKNKRANLEEIFKTGKYLFIAKSQIEEENKKEPEGVV